MASSQPRRPWWKKKRWAAALALWLAVAYPVSEGPYEYARVRRWISDTTAAYQPLDPVERWVPGLWTFRWQWEAFWVRLALKHSASD